MSNFEKIGRYRILRCVGAGAFATVWLGADDALDAFVAVKVLADNWKHQPDVRARFEQEARIMRRVDSLRLVRVLDIDELPDGRPYLVMPYAAGGTLADRLANGPLPVPEALAVATEIAYAVAELHQDGVLHRDLKPSNVLFDTVRGQQRVLVTDLGLAKALAHASGFTVAAGSPGYMAPEQARLGGGLDVRADVFAIGSILHHMLTGRVPPPVAEGGQPVRPSKLRPSLLSAVDEVVVRARQADPAKRYPSATELAEALRSNSQPDLVPARRRRWSRVAIAAALAVCLAGGITIARVMRDTTVRVSDATGGLSVAVPAAWAGEVRDGGWDPARLRLPAGHAPGLLVAPKVAGWSDPRGAEPGVFVGASRSLAAGGQTPTLPDHTGCVKEADREVTVAGTPAQVHRWIRCDGTAITYDEVLVAPAQRGFGVYVQIRQVDGQDRTDSVLDGLRMNSSLDPQAVGALRRAIGPTQSSSGHLLAASMRTPCRW